MHQSSLQEIEKIPYPPEYLEELKQLVPLVLNSVEREGLPIESGVFNVKGVDDNLDLALFFFYWITEINEIIENLNLTLADLRALPKTYLILKGSPKARYYLLVRTYFYEFYRFRESHHKAVKAATNRGFIKRNEVSEIRNSFHKAFEHTIDLRNILVHGSPVWKGEKHFNLSLVFGAWELGYALKSIETGEVWDIETVLKEVCDDIANTLREEGNRMSTFLKSLISAYVELTSNLRE